MKKLDLCEPCSSLTPINVEGRIERQLTDNFLSARADILPQQITDELAGLQDEVPPAPLPYVLATIVDELGAAPMPVGHTPSWNPAGFDPHDPAFLADPYPVYAQFREHGPAFFVSQYQSHWFFRFADCRAILSGDGTFQNAVTLLPVLGD